MNHTPNQTIVILFQTAGNGWIRQIKPVKPPPAKSRIPNRPPQSIPTFDRRALRERVDRYLRQTQQQRDQLRANAAEHLLRCCAA
jgi:hypothetical protein